MSIIRSPIEVEQRREAKAEKKEAKVEAKRNRPEKRTLDGWAKSSLEVGSPAYVRHMDKLEAQVIDAQNEMAGFADKMSEWADPKTAAGKARRWNDIYCDYMLNLCSQPLAAGLDGDSVMQSIGMFVGMSIVSKDFRQRSRATVKNNLLPISKKLAMSKASFLDAVCPRTGDGDMSRQEEIETAYDMRRKRYERALNGGRTPMTAEAAGVKYIGFCQQAYNMMRTDTPEMGVLRKQIEAAREAKEDMRAERLQGQLDLLEKQRNEQVMNTFNGATHSLKTVCAEDGITDDMFRDGVNKVYGKVVERHPEIEMKFNETAFGDVECKKEYRYDPKTKTTTQVFDGALMTKSGHRFNGLLTPRVPMSKQACTEKISDAYSSFYEPCRTMDEVAAVHEDIGFVQAQPYLSKVVRDDLSHVAISEGKDVGQYVESVLDSGHRSAAMRWMKERSEPADKAAEAAVAAEKEAKAVQREERAVRADERAEAQAQRDAEKHEWAREKHERDMARSDYRDRREERRDAKEDAQQDAFYRQMSRIMNSPKMREIIATKAAEGQLLSMAQILSMHTGTGSAGVEPEGMEM